MQNKHISLISSAIAYGYQYIIRLLPSVTMSDIFSKFHASHSEMGQFSGIYYIGYSIAHIPFGIMLDRVGIRLTFLISTLLSFLGILPMVIFDSWNILLVGRFISGVGSAGCTLSMLKSIGHHFPSKFSRILGLTATFSICFAIFGGKPIVLLIESFGFNSVIYGIMIAGACLSMMTLLLKGNSTKDNAIKDTSPILASLLLVVKNSKIYTMCILAGFMMGTLEGFADMWAVKFFTEMCNIDVANAALLSSMCFFGMAIGCPIVGYITDKTKKHNLISFICGLIMFCGLISIILITTNYFALVAFMITIGMTAAYQVPVTSKTALTSKKENIGLTMSYMNMLLMSCGYIFHSLIGYTYEVTESIVCGVSIVPALCIVGAIGFLVLYLKEKQQEKQ